MTEYVYILSNSSMPNLIKIGCTARKVEERVRELNSATGIPTPFIVEHIFETTDAQTLEYLIHKDLSPYRVTSKREFFELSPEEAISHIHANYQDKEQTGSTIELALLYLRQGQWEVENLPEELWSKKAANYTEYVEEKRQREENEKVVLDRLCDSIIHEVDRYPNDLWSPATKEIVRNIEAGDISYYEKAYLDRRKEIGAINTENAERLEQKKKLYKEFGFQYIEDAQEWEVSPLSVKHPDFHHAIQNQDFLRRLREL